MRFMMALFRSCAMLLAVFITFVIAASAQTVTSSNDTSEIPPYDSSPRFWVNGSDFTSFRILPLGWYSQITQSNFLDIDIQGRLIRVDASNANTYVADEIGYISCDIEDYNGVLGPNDVLRMVAQTQQGNAIILYSSRANHCDAVNLRAMGAAYGIFTTLDPTTAGLVAQKLSNTSASLSAVVRPDTQSYTISNGSSSGSGSSSYGPSSTQPGPTTAVAMIILYTITGIITALFIVIIVTGAVRAHRHPERYGPRNIAGRPRRSRAKGIARAMLDTIPIIKFGEKDEEPKKEVDIEMSSSASATAAQNDTTSATNTSEDAKDVTPIVATATSNPDGSNEAGQLGCSICTEDFTRGEEVRVLPCNHKFHPECVDPWLLNVSGTCPLCRIDLRPKEEQTDLPQEGEGPSSPRDSTAGPSQDRRRSTLTSDWAPPLGPLPIRLDRDRHNSTQPGNRRDTAAFATLRSVATASSEDRIAALRRFRQQRRGQPAVTEGQEAPEHEDERVSLSTRLRERFRIRTRRQGETDTQADQSQTVPRSQRLSMVGPPHPTWGT